MVTHLLLLGCFTTRTDSAIDLWADFHEAGTRVVGNGSAVSLVLTLRARFYVPGIYKYEYGGSNFARHV